MANLRCSAAEESEDTLNAFTSLTGYEPNILTFGELYDSSVPFSLMIPSSDQDVDDVTLGKMLTEAHRGQVDYCEPEGMSVSQSSSSVMFDGSGQPDGERMVDQSGKSDVTFNVISAHSNFSEDIQTEKMVDLSGQPDERNSSNAQIRTLLEEQRQTIIAEYREKVGHHELQAAHAEEERRLLQGQLRRQKLEFREAHQQSLTEMEELPKFQSSTFDTIARRKLIEDQNTILELSGRVQELQDEVNFMNDSKDFQDAESVRSGNSHVTSRPVSFPPHPIPEGMLRHSFVSPCRKEGPPSIWDTHGISGNVFANPDASSSAPYPQELHQWNSSIEEPLHSSTVEKSERQEQDQDLRCQSGPSAKDSVIFSGGDSSNNYGADQQRLQILDLHFDKFPTPATFACWKIRFKTEVCTCSQFPTEAMQWIKEVELVDSVDELESSSSRSLYGADCRCPCTCTRMELELHSCPAGHCGVRGFRTLPRKKKVRRQGGSRVRTCCRTRCRPGEPPVRSSTCSTGSHGGGASGIQTPGGWWTQRMEPGSALSYGGPRGSSISRRIEFAGLGSIRRIWFRGSRAALPLLARAVRIRIWTLSRRVLFLQSLACCLGVAVGSVVHSTASKNSRIQECTISIRCSAACSEVEQDFLWPSMAHSFYCVLSRAQGEGLSAPLHQLVELCGHAHRVKSPAQQPQQPLWTGFVYPFCELPSGRAHAAMTDVEPQREAAAQAVPAAGGSDCSVSGFATSG